MLFWNILCGMFVLLLECVIHPSWQYVLVFLGNIKSYLNWYSVLTASLKQTQTNFNIIHLYKKAAATIFLLRLFLHWKITHRWRVHISSVSFYQICISIIDDRISTPNVHQSCVLQRGNVYFRTTVIIIHTGSIVKFLF